VAIPVTRTISQLAGVGTALAGQIAMSKFTAGNRVP
jgi:hypothetical protein